MAEQKSAENRATIERLNKLIMLAQWDGKLPLYTSRLFTDPDKYQKALEKIRAGLANHDLAGQSSSSPAPDLLSDDEWEKLYGIITTAPQLRELFNSDPFPGASSAQLSALAEVADITTDPQTMVYSRNGTFLGVVEALRQSPELDTEQLIWEGLNKFFTLLDTNEPMAEMLYHLARSNEWYVVMASLRDGRDYAREEGAAATVTLKQWNEKLNSELRAILFKPTHLSRVPKKLVQLAWEKRGLFSGARNSIAPDKHPSNPWRDAYHADQSPPIEDSLRRA